MVALGTTAAVTLAACASSGSSTAGTSSAAPKSGGSLTVIENSNDFGTWPSLDPATSLGEVGPMYMDPIFGDLFEQGANGSIIDDLATGYKYLNGGKTFEIDLRHGVTFSDGTPFNAAAVADNFRRDLQPSLGSPSDSDFPVSSVTTSGNYTVDLHLTKVDGQVINSFFGNPENWIASPTALQKEGLKQFEADPVGAGPFEVESNEPSAKLVLKKNPHYWEPGRPYLNQLTFELIGSDESAYAALVSGEAQVYQGFTSYGSIKSDQQQVNVVSEPAIYGPDVIRFNTSIAPFSNQLAREAIYYATDAGPILKAVSGGYGNLAEMLSDPGGLYYQPSVAGYPSYNLSKAKSLVQQLGGLNVSLEALNTPGDVQIDDLLQSEWAQAGIHTTLSFEPGSAYVGTFQANKWQAFMGADGGYDPALGSGLPLWTSSSLFTGVHDPTLDNMIATAAEALDTASATPQYDAIWSYIASKAYSPVLFTIPDFQLVAKGVTGPGLSTYGYAVQWQNVSAG